MNAITFTSKNFFPRPESTYMLNACWDFKNRCCANQLTTSPLHLSVPICVLAWSTAPPPSQNLGDVPDSALGRSSDFQVGETLPMPPSAYDPPRPPRTLIFPEVS